MRATSIVLIALLATLALAPARAAEPAFVATMSRGVKVFSGLELQLNAAARAKNLDAVDALLDENFELRESAGPGRPVPRGEWRERIATDAPAEIELSQMAVHDLGSHAVVSFLSRDKDAAAAVSFVVDVWRKDGDAWRLMVRYRSPAKPGAEDTAPTGRN